jgi:CubicO group peptidase (beta-lactamase class C family)
VARLGAALMLVSAVACTAERAATPQGDQSSAARSGAPPASSAPAREISVPPQIAADAGGADAAEQQAMRPVDRALLDQLVADARSSDSDALVILQDGKLVGEWYFTAARAPIQTMSITKSVLSLAIGSLVDQRKLRLDQPVSELYPVWRGEPRGKITLQHLLTHSSGLEEGKTSRDIYAQASFVDFSLRSKLLFEPGTHFEYSNRGANLIAGIVAKASGSSTERFLARTIFEPLGIRQYQWSKDKSGQVQGLAGLHLVPRDLAKLGELLLGEGVWQDRRIVSAEWIRRSTLELAPVQPTNKRLAMLWWLVPAWTRVTIDDSIVSGWRAGGVGEEFVRKVQPLVGRRFDSLTAFVAALRERFGDPKLVEWAENTYRRGLADARFEFGPVVGSYSSGTLGQYLVVLPRDRLVAVRMRRAPKNAAERDLSTKTFPDFVERVQALLR